MAEYFAVFAILSVAIESIHCRFNLHAREWFFSWRIFVLKISFKQFFNLILIAYHQYLLQPLRESTSLLYLQSGRSKLLARSFSANFAQPIVPDHIVPFWPPLQDKFRGVGLGYYGEDSLVRGSINDGFRATRFA